MIGHPFVLDLTSGNVADVTAAPKLIERAAGLGYLIGDKGYDADSLRAMIRARGGRPVIPGEHVRIAGDRVREAREEIRRLTSKLP